MQKSHTVRVEPQPIADQWMVRCTCGWSAPVGAETNDMRSEAYRRKEEHLTGMAWPDWEDLGKVVEVTYKDGSIARGKLAYDDTTPGPEEAPLFYVRREDGSLASFAGQVRWRFAYPDFESVTKPRYPALTGSRGRSSPP